MKSTLFSGHRLSQAVSICLLGLCFASVAHAGLFEDKDARKAILDLRQRVDQSNTDSELTRKSIADESMRLGQSLLGLQRQIELLRTEVATLRGSNERLTKELTDLQLRQKDHTETLNERLGRLEPTKTTLDGVEFLADPREKADFETALAAFKKGNFVVAQNLFAGFVTRNPASPYAVPALFWLGNAQYATRDYKEAIINFRALIAKSPKHLRASEALLSIANCQLELKESKAARKTLTDLIKSYPDTEAAQAAKERLASLK